MNLPPHSPDARPVSSGHDLPESLGKLLGEMRAGFWRWDPEADHITAWGRLDELWGLPPGQSLRDSLTGFKLIHPEDLGRQQELVRAAVKHGGSWHNEFRILRPRDGKVAWLEERAHSETGPSGKLVIEGVTRDITALREAEEALRASERRYHHLLASIQKTGQQAEQALNQALKTALSALELKNTLYTYAEEIAGLGTWTWDSNSNRAVYSDNMFRLFGLEPGEIVPNFETLPRFIHPEDLQAVLTSGEALRRGESDSIAIVYRAIRKDGAERVFSNRVQMMPGPKGGRMLVGITEDITERRREEERGRRLIRERLELEDRQRLALLAAALNAQEEERRRISESLHNGLGQMLYGIQLNLKQLDLQVGDAWENRHFDQQRRTTRLLGDAIDETRRASHELMPHVLEDFGLQTAVDDICRQFRGTLNVDCRFSQLPGDIPQYISIALYRTVQELMTNIVKHAGAACVEVSIVHADGAYELNVRDDGGGFDASTRTEGIGLKTLREKISLLKGTFELVSGAEGTTVRVRIPDGS